MGFFKKFFGLEKTDKEEIKQINPGNPYSSMTHRQKLAAMNLMMVFGGSCSGSAEEISKINHIMTQEGQLMGVSGVEMHAATSTFTGMTGMADSLKGVERKVLERLFYVFYCVIAAGKNVQAAQVLIAIYKDYGFSEQECFAILEKVSGKKITDV